jgi:hypothetical protein
MITEAPGDVGVFDLERAIRIVVAEDRDVQDVAGGTCTVTIP